MLTALSVLHWMVDATGVIVLCFTAFIVLEVYLRRNDTAQTPENGYDVPPPPTSHLGRGF